MVNLYVNLSIFTLFLKNRIFTSKIKRSKVTDYAALTLDPQYLNFLNNWVCYPLQNWVIYTEYIRFWFPSRIDFHCFFIINMGKYMSLLIGRVFFVQPFLVTSLINCCPNFAKQ